MPKKCLKIGLYVLLVFFLTAVAFLFYQNYQLRQQIQQAQVATSTPTAATPTPAPTANWKMYKNEKHGYEMEYSPSYQADVSENALCLRNFSEQSYCDISVFSKTIGEISLEAYIQESFGFPQDKSLTEFFKEMDWEYSTKQTGNNSWFYFHHNEGPGEGPRRNFIKSNGIVVGIYAFTAEIQRSNEFNLMLSTFEFMD